jgi:Flp pilus assembly pilin Flp
MMLRLLKLRRNERGMSAVEFALVAPAFCTFIIAIAQFGILFFAQSGLKSAVAEGARYANIYPRPSNELILARITERRFGMDPAKIIAPTITPGTSGGRSYLDIEMKYDAQMNFIFFTWSDLRLTEKRRVFVYT